MLTRYLKQVIRGEELSPSEMAEAMGLILDGASAVQVAVFLVALTLCRHGLICDGRSPGVVRMTPAPLFMVDDEDLLLIDKTI